jgi:hypothetical protein
MWLFDKLIIYKETERNYLDLPITWMQDVFVDVAYCFISYQEKTR